MLFCFKVPTDFSEIGKNRNDIKTIFTEISCLCFILIWNIQNMTNIIQIWENSI